MQKLFSIPSFLISAAHFLDCITVLGLIAMESDIFIAHPITFIQLVLLIVNSFGGLLSCLWMAGGLPMEADKLHEAFCEKLQQRLLFVGKVDKIRIENSLQKNRHLYCPAVILCISGGVLFLHWQALFLLTPFF
ncbi:uncharacterized protein CEXT_642121 [Caerostris extrusa]|uniref:Uncharacterized protein n=1 Tax=Caerostris extrusa TaxID=172846 RepID=A0AAV4WEH0_CAEEX|nr:uncharacterized protein CEXT_642121 [Caerostris extrusa]